MSAPKDLTQLLALRLTAIGFFFIAGLFLVLAGHDVLLALAVSFFGNGIVYANARPVSSDESKPGVSVSDPKK